MNRLLDNPAAQRTADTRQEQPPTKRPSKGSNRSGKSVAGAADITAAHKILGRPVAIAGQRNAAPIGVAFRALREKFGTRGKASSESHGVGDLQVVKLSCNI